jgi:transcriptional regulator GlxA family with amidase domain
MAKSTSAHQVFMVVFPGFLLLDAAGPLQVFSTADDEAAKTSQNPRYRLRTVSVSGGLITSAAGLPVLTETLPPPAKLQGATVLVAGGDGTPQAMQSKRLLAWLQKVAPRAARCGSVCTGSFILAQAGLLDGRRAVTHWHDAPLFKRLFPKVRLLDDAIHVRDGHVYTSAGITAGIDLALSLVEDDHDRALSLRVAKRLVVPLRRSGGQRQFSAELLAQVDEAHGLVTQLSAWLKPRLKQALSVSDMAHALSMSERTLHRQLIQHTGQSPARFLNRLRLERACALLESGQPAIKRVVQQTGFGSEYNLRRAFKQALGVSPTEYVYMFCGRRLPKAA